jgi:hypothetical protein
MRENLLNALCPALAAGSFAVSFWLGFRGTSSRRSLVLGWSLFVLAYVFQDLLSPGIAFLWLGRDAANRVSVDQPGTAAAVLGGWVPALMFFKLGQAVQRKRHAK